MHIKTFIITLLFTFLFSTQIYASIEPSDEQSPPQPSTSNLQINDAYINGSTVLYDGMYIGRYTACNYQPTFYGSYLTMRNGSPYLVVSQYYQVGVNGSLTITDLQYQSFIGSDYRATYLWSQNLISWGQVSNQPTNISSSAYQTFNNGIIYYVKEEYWSLPSDNFSAYESFNDSVLILDLNWANLTDSEKFNYAVNFSHSSLTSYYDSTIPSFVHATFSMQQSVTDSLSIYSPVVTGSLNSLLSDGTTFDSSIYYIDILATVTAGEWRSPTDDSSKRFTYATPINSYDFYYSSYNRSSLDLSVFNSQFRRDFENLSLTGSVASYSIVPDKVLFNVRLRRKSDGCFGNWLVLDLSNTGLGDMRDGYSAIGSSGLTIGSDSSIPTSQIDSNLSSQAGLRISFDLNGEPLGTSYNGSRLYQGGGYQGVDVGAVTEVFADVPLVFSAVFSFLPPFVLDFIGVAFVTVVAVALVKAIL